MQIESRIKWMHAVYNIAEISQKNALNQAYQ